MLMKWSGDMLYRKLWRTMGLYKAQFISMIIMIALGVGVFVGFNMEWVSIEQNTGDFFEKTGFADYRVVSDEGFTREEAKDVDKLKEVDAAARYVSVPADVKERDGDSVALTVTEDPDISGFMLIGKGEKYDSKSSDGIWLSDKYADANDISRGDRLTLVCKGIKFKGRVAGLIKSSEHMICVRDESQLMPDYSTYGYAYISPKMYEKAVGYPYYPQINILSDKSKKAVSDAVDDVLGKTTLLLTKDEVGSYSEAMGESEEGKTMGSVIPVLFLLIAVLTMVTTMHRIAAREKTQIGTLKALGFKDKRILRHYTSYAFMTGLAGTAVGTGLGYLIAWMIMNPDGSMGTYLDMPWWELHMPLFCWLILAGIVVMLTVIGYLSVKQMLRGTPADALRPYSPKKVRHMLIERTALWKKAGFGTRWNLRDTMRHKSRTLMSLLGTVGCALILICSLGMRDTMDAFLDMYYDGATNYASRIYMADDTDNAQAEKIADRYDGDWSATVSVQIDDDAVALDIYDIRSDKVRFLDSDDDYVDIGNDGAYICTRISDKYDLHPGDRFTVSPYGSDDEYKLTVKGITRSVSENIVISKKYADRKDISYRIDSVYTDTAKADIHDDDRISSVQSRQAIMDSFDTFMEIMNMMVFILMGGAVILGVVVLYNLGVMSYTERYREMATLKVVGFKDRKIGALLTGQNMWVTAVGVIIGIPAGKAVLQYLMDKLASEYEMKVFMGPATYLISILITLGVSLAVSFMVARKNKNIDMVEALKGAE